MNEAPFFHIFWEVLENQVPAFTKALRKENRHFFHEEFEKEINPEVLREVTRLIREYDMWGGYGGPPCMSIPDPQSGRSIEVYDDDAGSHPLTDDLNLMVYKM